MTHPSQFTWNRTLFDEPVGLGFVTTTGIGPGCVIRYAGTVTRILDPVFDVGKRIELPRLITTPLSKFAPEMVSANDAEPAGTALGDS